MISIDRVKKVIKVGVLGGSFDPPTISHLQLCSEVIYVKKFDQVLIIPCGEREDKQLKNSPNVRLQMLKLAI